MLEAFACIVITLDSDGEATSPSRVVVESALLPKKRTPRLYAFVREHNHPGCAIINERMTAVSLGDGSARNVFTNIFRGNGWGGGESRSGRVLSRSGRC